MWRLIGHDVDRVPGRLALGPVGLRTGHVVALVVLLIVAVAVTIGWISTHRPETTSVPPRAVDTSNASPSAPPGANSKRGVPAKGDEASADATPTGTASPDVVHVHVAGKVASPGVVELPAGSRVAEAIEAAGGPRDGVDLRTVNLARPLADGEQVLVGYPPEEGAPEATPSEATESARTSEGEQAAEDGEPIDLNAATAEELEALPGVGPVLAERMVEYREEQGGFGSVEELNDVSGIGEKRFADLRERVRVG